MGGVGKGHLVREIDALGGVIASVADEAAIHFRLLNRSRGAATRGPRVQCDRERYKRSMQARLAATPRLDVLSGSVDDLLLDEAPGSEVGGKPVVRGVLLGDGSEVCGSTVVLTTGTFLRGIVHIGRESYPAGRHRRDSAEVEAPAVALALTLERAGFPLARLTTGTPPRVAGSSIRWEGLTPVPSDVPPVPLSFGTRASAIDTRSHITCHLTHTNADTAAVIDMYRDQLPVFEGNEGKGQGPRYCPAIEKKVLRFPDKPTHQVFLEPEGLDTDTVYPNGLNTAFPPEVRGRAGAGARACGLVWGRARVCACSPSGCRSSSSCWRRCPGCRTFA